MITDEQLLELTSTLIKKFIINVRQIVNNSDHEMEDMFGEAYVVVFDNYQEILLNERTFINELKKKCLPHNKYGRRIESAKVWSKFNQLEESLPERMGYSFEINTDAIVGLRTIRQYVSENEYEFLIFYYDWGMKKTSKEYGITDSACRKKVYNLKKRILKGMNS